MSEASNLDFELEEIEFKKFEKEKLETIEITEENIEKLINYDILTQKEKEIAEEFCKKIDITNEKDVTKIAEKLQGKTVEYFFGTVGDKNEENKKKVKELFKQLYEIIEEFDENVPNSLKPKGVQGLFFNAQNHIEKMIIKYDENEIKINKIEKQLETQKIKMLKAITEFDKMYNECIEYFKEISLYIILYEKCIKEKNKNISSAFNSIKEIRKKVANIIVVIRNSQNRDSEFIEKLVLLLNSGIHDWRKKCLISLGIENSSVDVENLKKVNKEILDKLSIMQNDSESQKF